MRISGQDRTSVFCFSPIHSPGIAAKREASLLHKRAEGGLSLHKCKELFGRKVTVAASCAVCRLRSCILGREGKKTVELSRIERLCQQDRKSTRLNSSHVAISYAVFCLKKKKKNTQ